VADIDIQRKEGPGIWPWVIGALALVAIIWGVMHFTGDDRQAGTEPATTPAAEQPATYEPAPAPVPGPAPAPGMIDPAAPGTGTTPGTGTDTGTGTTTDPAGTGTGTPGQGT
jgi:hypothetical protein